MASANDKLRDFQVGHQVRLVRMSNSEQKRLQRILRQTDVDLQRELTRRVRPLTTFRKKRLVHLKGQVRRIIKETQAPQIRDAMSGIMAEVAEAELEIQTAALTRTMSQVGLDVGSVNVSRVLTAARGIPADGTPVGEMLRRFHQGDFERTWRRINAGIFAGQTNDEIVRSVIGTRGLGGRDATRQATRRAAHALVRTVNSHVSNTAREQLWGANEDIISGVQWVATLDGRTTPICRSLDGKVFPVGEGPRPPVHISCRSVTTPVIRGLEDLRQRADVTRAASLRTAPGAPTPFDGEVSGALNYGDWLQRQPVGFQKEVLGPTRFKLFREGATMDTFVSDAGVQLPLKELRRKTPQLFKAAGL